MTSSRFIGSYSFFINFLVWALQKDFSFSSQEPSMNMPTNPLLLFVSFLLQYQQQCDSRWGTILAPAVVCLRHWRHVKGESRVGEVSFSSTIWPQHVDETYATPWYSKIVDSSSATRAYAFRGTNLQHSYNLFSSHMSRVPSWHTLLNPCEV